MPKFGKLSSDKKILFTVILLLSLILFDLSVVEFASKSDMSNALRKLDDTELFGKRVKLVSVSIFIYPYCVLKVLS